VTGPASAFFHAAGQFLSLVSPGTLSPEERRQWAREWALAAAVGEGVVSFGDVLSSPALVVLEGTPDAWLLRLLAALQLGDVDAFNAVLAAHAEAVAREHALAAALPVVREKAALLALMELAAARAAGGRSLAFADVAAAARLGADQVEWLVMRALSLGLVRGVLDQVDERVHVTYVQPRTLHESQIARMRARVSDWAERTRAALGTVTDGTSELFA
jgi:26S proteasome regulatory subunit N9